MKRVIAIASVAALSVVGFAGTAQAAGKGGEFQQCFSSNYGQSGLAYGQLKKSFPEGHPAVAPYGLAGVLAAHGPDGVAPLC